MSEEQQNKLEQLNEEFENISKDDIDELNSFAQELYDFNSDYVKSAIKRSYNASSPYKYADHVTVRREDPLNGNPSECRYYAYVNDDRISLNGNTLEDAINNMVALQGNVDYKTAKRCLNNSEFDNNIILSLNNENLNYIITEYDYKETEKTVKSEAEKNEKAETSTDEYIDER